MTPAETEFQQDLATIGVFVSKVGGQLMCHHPPSGWSWAVPAGLDPRRYDWWFDKIESERP